MTDEAQDVAEDDVVTEEEVAELMAGEPPQDVPAVAEPAPPEPQPAQIPWRRLVIGVTDGGLITFLLDQTSMLEKAEIARQLGETARMGMARQAEAFERAKAAGDV